MKILKAAKQLQALLKGGPGSGDWGHTGRPGQVGGSGGGGGAHNLPPDHPHYKPNPGGGGGSASDGNEIVKDGLTKNELSAIEDWSHVLYRDSADPNPSKDAQKKLGHFHDALEKLPNREGMIYRTMVLGPGQKIEGTWKGLKTDNLFQANRPLATSKSKSVASDFADDSAMPQDTVVRFAIKAKTAKDISQYVAEEYREQQEVVAMPGSQYVIGKIKRGKGEHGGKVIDVQLTEVSTNTFLRDQYLDRIGKN